MDRWLNKGKDSNSIGFSSHIFSGTEGTIKHANEGCEYANEVALFLTKLAKTQRHQPPDIQMSRVCKWVRHWFINITALIGGYFSPHSTVTNFHLFSPPPPFYQLIRLKWNDTQPIELSCSFFLHNSGCENPLWSKFRWWTETCKKKLEKKKRQSINRCDLHK